MTSNAQPPSPRRQLGALGSDSNVGGLLTAMRRLIGADESACERELERARAEAQHVLERRLDAVRRLELVDAKVRRNGSRPARFD